MIKIHNYICQYHESHETVIQLSLDGILEAKSSMNSLDTYSLKFINCRSIYPLKIIKPSERFRYDEQEHIREVLDDLNASDVDIDCCVLDNPKRGVVKCMKTACAKHACDYCENCAVSYAHPKSGRKQLTWPASTMIGNLRTIEKIEEIVQNIEENPEILKSDPDYCKGIKGRSHLLNQPNFNMLKSVHCEYMHCVCLGVIKRMVEVNFKVGENRNCVTKRKLSSPQLFNEKIRSIQLTRECSRRCRNLDLGVMKASEYRNLLIIFFPVVLECIEDEFENDKRIWLHLVYMIRACIIPNEEFREIDKNTIESACQKFYSLYEKLYGQHNCTYSVHVVTSHLMQIRGNMPLTYRSAFKFESFFSEMRNMFQPGTVSPLKQIVQNCYVKRILESHHCEKTVYYCQEKVNQNHPSKENNSLIYVHAQNGITMYKIIDTIDKDSYTCVIQGKFKAHFSITPEYDWSKVGVFKLGPLSDDKHVVNRSEISGKVIKVNNYLITCPTNVLIEQ